MSRVASGAVGEFYMVVDGRNFTENSLLTADVWDALDDAGKDLVVTTSTTTAKVNFQKFSSNFSLPIEFSPKIMILKC